MLSAYSEEENKIFSQESGNEIFQITNSKKELELLKNKSNNIYNIIFYMALSNFIKICFKIFE